jgi:MinD-like ATPase involved in chromosome partitioning or flagellar assembly
MTQITTFFAPKTSGNTVLSLNTAICAQHKCKDKKTLLWQLTVYPDLHIYSGIKPQKNWSQLLDFVGTKEFDAALLSKVIRNQGVDLLLSPPKKDWENISISKWQKILALIMQTYDCVIIDLHESIPAKMSDIILAESERIILTTLVDPASLQAVKFWHESQDNITQAKCSLIANQCSRDSLRTVRSKLNLEALSLLTAIPLARRGLWEQVYQGFPLVFNKQNKWKKYLLEVVKVFEG